MSTYYITEEYLGSLGTEKEARRMVELLNERGYNAEYGIGNGRNDEDAAPSDKDWMECLDIIAEESTLNLQKLAQRFGTVTHDGTEYTLAQDADFSNRQFTRSWFDAGEGDEYTAEFSAKAFDAEGNEYWVYWQFDTVKGEEPALDGYPWSDKHIVRVVPQ